MKSCTGGRLHCSNTTLIWIAFGPTCAQQQCGTTRQTPSITSCFSDACAVSRRSQSGTRWPHSSSRVGAIAAAVRTLRVRVRVGTAQAFVSTLVTSCEQLLCVALA